MSDDALESEVRKQMGKWFGPFDVSSWKLLKIYRIPFAQPIQVCFPNETFLTLYDRRRRRILRNRFGLGTRFIFVAITETLRRLKVRFCVFRFETADLGAIKSGRRAAEAIFKDVS